jgi:membrane associated rhomboid family serine protease
MTSGSEILLRITNDDRLAQDWELVLLSQGLSPRVRRTRDGIVLAVTEKEAEVALASLAAYDRENPPKLAEKDEPAGSANLAAGATVAGMLVAFYTVTVSNPSVPWLERGSAHAGRILAGEIWRTVTALTLHGDLAHALSNAVAIALFLGVASAVVGVGPACLLVLLAGAGGNLANALLQNSPHVAVGASTAVFGAVGILGGHAMLRHHSRRARKRKAWIPVAATFALLAMLGTEGARVDVWAHLLGLLVGCGLGALTAFVVPRALGRTVQWLCGCAALAATVYCWRLALG